MRRLAMLVLAFALQRVFNRGVALGTLLFLAIDPTVAAHLPAVMTDLPVALLSTTAVVLHFASGSGRTLPLAPHFSGSRWPQNIPPRWWS